MNPFEISPPNRDCSATVTPDPDIGGPGVMFAFLIQSWVTVFFAAFPAFHVAKLARKRWKAGKLESGEEQEVSLFSRALGRSSRYWDMTGPDPPSAFVIRAAELLNPLCDLQLITGLGIVIAGFAKWRTISFYHEALVACYWNLTLNSFWAARIGYMDYDTDENIIRVVLRRSSMLLSCLLGIAWQLFTWLREHTAYRYPGGQWEDENDLCYRYLDGTSPVPWVLGIFFYCVALICSMTERTAMVQKKFDDGLEKVQDCADKWYWESRKRRHVVVRAFEVPIAFVMRASWWVSVQWIAVWSFGDGFLPFTWLFYLLFVVWNTFDVMSLWVMNMPLLGAEERQWGFGQVLPLIMLLSIIFSGVDICSAQSTNKSDSRICCPVGEWDMPPTNICLRDWDAPVANN